MRNPFNLMWAGGLVVGYLLAMAVVSLDHAEWVSMAVWSSLVGVLSLWDLKALRDYTRLTGQNLNIARMNSQIAEMDGRTTSHRERRT